MQISLKWINELVSLKLVNVENLIDRLTLGGFEVEEVFEVKLVDTKIIVLEISATANRSDSLSIQGLASEIAILINCKPNQLNFLTKSSPWFQHFKNIQSNSLNNNNCSGFISIIVNNLDNFTSPKWLQQKLISSGVSISNNLSDFQTYVLLETGYPIECYDFDQILAKVNNSQVQLSLTTPTHLLKFSADNNKTYLVENPVLIIKANSLPISIAGIISTKETSPSINTKSLLIEASIFNAAKIRQESRILNLRTDRSSRYEKSLKKPNLIESIYRIVSLLRLENPKLTCKLHTIANLTKDPTKKIKIKYEKVKQVLGPIRKLKDNQYQYISLKNITHILKQLNFQVNLNNENEEWTVDIPPLRVDDIVDDIDIIEEIGRVYGFNSFLPRLPNIKMIGQEDATYQTRKKLTNCLINLDLTELIQYSLVTKEQSLTDNIGLINPLVKDYSNLRSSLLPSLLNVVADNLKRTNTILEGFEYGHLFTTKSDRSVTELEVVAGVFSGRITEENWFNAKGKIDKLFKKLKIVTYWSSAKPPKAKNLFHSYRIAELFLSNGAKIGVFGQISPILAHKSLIPVNIYLFEFDFNIIHNQTQQNKVVMYQEYSLYPKIIKDLSFIINETISFNEVKNLLYLNGSQFLREINFLNEYRGNSIPSGHISLCLQLIFQSDSETLYKESIQSIIIHLSNILVKKLNVTIRI